MNTVRRSENRTSRRPSTLGERVLIFAAVALIIALGIHFAGSGAVADGTPEALSLQGIEFAEIYYNPSLHGSIMADKISGVMYWVGEGGAATLLVDDRGRPRVWRSGNRD